MSDDDQATGFEMNLLSVAFLPLGECLHNTLAYSNQGKDLGRTRL